MQQNNYNTAAIDVDQIYYELGLDNIDLNQMG